MSSQLLTPKLETLLGPQHAADPILAATYNLEDLVSDIKTHLGNSHGIDSSDVDSDHLISLAQKYISDPADWLRFFHNDTSKNYTRNAIENINHKANIVSPLLLPDMMKSNLTIQLLLVWNPGKGSPIHDHANAHCIMKVLAGQLRETVYHAPEEQEDGSPLKIKSATTHGIDAVSYISDDIGLHRVHNPSSDQVAVSLHCMCRRLSYPSFCFSYLVSLYGCVC